MTYQQERKLYKKAEKILVVATVLQIIFLGTLVYFSIIKKDIPFLTKVRRPDKINYNITTKKNDFPKLKNIIITLSNNKGKKLNTGTPITSNSEMETGKLCLPSVISPEMIKINKDEIVWGIRGQLVIDGITITDDIALAIYNNKPIKRVLSNKFINIVVKTRQITSVADTTAKILGLGLMGFLGYSYHERRKRKRFQYLSYTDKLTGLNNRDYFDTVLGAEILKSINNNTPLSLMMIDIDFFKKVNDTYGHQAGDSVLVTVSQILKKHSRDTDIPFRYGGEEMGIILPNSTAKEAEEYAQRIRKAIAEHRFFTDKNITVSIGIAEYKQNTTQETLVKWADTALYDCKRKGRNCCRVYAV